MTYDTRTRRSQRVRKARLLGFIGLATVLVVGGFTFFSMHVYWTGELVSKLVLRLTGGRSEFALPPVQQMQDWKGRKDMAATFPPASLSDGHIRFEATQPPAERKREIDKQLRREKFRRVEPLEQAPFAMLTEQADRTGHTFLRKQVLALLPGESIELAAGTFSTNSPDIIFRCLGATADRLDLPGRLEFQHPVSGAGIIPISPRGEPVTYRPPELVSSAPLRLTWDRQAPGLLVVAGEFKVRKTTPGILVVTMERAQMEALRSFQSTLRSQGFATENVRPAWPTTVDAAADSRTLFTEPVTATGEALPAHLTNLGFTSLHLNIAPGKPQESPWTGANAEIHVQRTHELRLGLRQTLARLSADDLVGTVVSLRIGLPAEEFALTWKSALAADTSLLSWLYASWLGKALAPNLAFARQAEEKALQIDEPLADFLRSPAARSLGLIVVAAQSNADTRSRDQAPPVAPGELLVAARGKSLDAFRNLVSTRDLPQALVATLTDAPPPAPATLALIERSREDLLISEQGWLALPILSSKDPSTNNVPLALRVGFLAEVRKERERRGFRNFNISLPKPHPALQVNVKGVPAGTRCSATAPDSPPESHLESGLLQLSIPASASPVLVRCSWRLPQPPSPDFVFSASRDGLPVPPDELAFGAFAISGGVLANPTTGEITLPLQGEFAPAMVPPLTTAEPLLHAWVEDFSPENGEAR